MTAATYVDLVVDNAGRHPDTCAVAGGALDVTYADLLERARDLAGRLAAAGCRPGDGVALITGRDLTYIVGMLGIGIAGCAAVPISADEPPPRRELLLRRLPLRAAVSGNVHVEPVRAPPAARGGLHGIAYVLFTSGSTGLPRPVMVGHRALLLYLQWAADTLLDPRAPMPVLSAPGFDAILKQALGPLLRGGTVLLLDDDTARNPGELARLLTGPSEYTINCVPSLWRAVLAEVPPGSTLSIRRLLLGGEAVDEALATATRAAAPQVEIWNLYGPTEATANAMATVLGDQDDTRLGTALPHTTVYLLDRALQPVGPDGTGEIHIGGLGLADGYAGAPAATAERFVPDPFAASPGARMFRTGDLAMRRGGDLVFAGRIDRQFKRLGVRVEPGEVESALRDHAQIHDAAAAITTDPAGQPRLTVAVEPVASASPTSGELRQYLRGVLHPAAVPDIIVPVARIPRNPSGKPDTAAIARLAHHSTPRPDPPGATVDPLLDALCAVWADVLGRPVAPDDDFFEIGGHSIAMLRIAGRLSRLLTLDLSIDMFYDTPTVAQQTATIRHLLGDEANLRARLDLSRR